jgi:hypothetical protein
VLDLLCKGKQSVIPETVHPGTDRPYEWLTDDTLDMSTSFVPSRELSMLAALAIMGTFISRRYVGPSAGVAPNLYLVGLASTGRGKDGPLKAAKNIFASSGMTHFLGAGDVSSDAAIERLIREKPACLLTMDEIGTCWSAARLSQKAETSQQGLADRIGGEAVR